MSSVNISCKAGLEVQNTFSFCLSVRLFNFSLKSETGRQENSNQDFLAVVKEVNEEYVTISQRNNFNINEEVEAFGPNTLPTVFKILEMKDKDGN